MRVKFFRKESSSFCDDFLHALKVAMVVCPTAVIIITMFYTVPAIETRYFPVVTNFHITKIVAVDGGSMVSAEADKVRECPRWRLTLWYYGQRDGGNVPLPTMQHLDPPEGQRHRQGPMGAHLCSCAARSDQEHLLRRISCVLALGMVDTQRTL